MRIRFAILSALALCGMLSCSKISGESIPVQPEPQQKTIDVMASIILPDGGMDGVISSSQKAKLCQCAGGSVNLYVSTDVNAGTATAPAHARFKNVAVPAEGQSCEFTLVYPSSCSEGLAGEELYLKISPEQTPQAAAADLSAMLMVGLGARRYGEIPSKIDFRMAHACAFVRLRVCGLELEEGERLRSALVSAPGKQLAGSARLNTANGAIDYDSPASASGIMLLAQNITPDAGGFDLWMLSKPFSLDQGEGMEIVLYTDQHTFKASFTSESQIDFRAGTLTELSADVEKEPAPDPGHEKVNPDPGYTVTGNIWYVSANGDDKNSGTASSDAFKTFDHVLTKIAPGDQVRILPGLYETTAWNGNIDLQKKHSGSEGSYISFVAADPDNRPVLHAGGKGVWNAININASYVAFDGIEVVGDNDKINFQDAYNFAKKYFETGSCDWGEAAVYNTNGISIGATGQKSELPHHVIIRNCVVHDMPGGGISAIQADYVTVEYNTIYNCAWYMMYGGSGISFLTPVHIDNNTGYKMIVRGNKVFNCRTEVPWVRIGVAFSNSDGNGIIIDVNATPDKNGIAPDQGEYRGRTLVVNNISVNNGGSGIHAYKANHVDMVGNTAYHNGHMYSDNSYGEIWAHQGGDIRIYNNIMYARPGGRCNLGSGAVYTNNLYFGGQVKISGTGDLNADPLFINLSKSIEDADFHLTESSPAIGHGSMSMSPLPGFDHDFYVRAERFDCGAYQYIEK